MNMKKRVYECLLCKWIGDTPQNVSTYDGTFKVCPVCSLNKDIPTEALILNLEVYTFDE